MPAPKTPNTTAATSAVIRRGDETAARRLTEHGWIVIAPETLAELDEQDADAIRGHAWTP